MKKILSLMLVLMANCSLQAGTSVDWYDGAGFYPHGAADVTSATPGTGIAASQAVIWQLIWAGGNNAIDIVDTGNSAGGYVYNDDVVLATRNVPANDPTYTEWVYGTAGQFSLFQSGTTYAGVFYQRVLSSTTPSVGDWYYNSPTLAAVNWTSGDPDQVFDGNSNPSLGGDAMNVQIVPEPSSMALLAIGLGVVALRRMRRS